MVFRNSILLRILFLRCFVNNDWSKQYVKAVFPKVFCQNGMNKSMPDWYPTEILPNSPKSRLLQGPVQNGVFYRPAASKTCFVTRGLIWTSRGLLWTSRAWDPMGLELDPQGSIWIPGAWFGPPELGLPPRGSFGPLGLRIYITKSLSNILV
jgi:hypothetical protein